MFIVFFAMALKDEAEMKEFNSVYSISLLWLWRMKLK